ncbi:TetR/AcrR family transcriptional regulator [Streptomyces sp. NA04227]|uniref:TetR/AcrR family transcriptional regulator n=1 Tax=Streptomyces sp. NA04227 TaxID=2742136 RepID=UPI0015900BA6|nr:TetR/AcrR family transcriptional regulator [Streptomyces sp. NA04227]QKW05812.1 TetR/AcrR family transcriptional regulator [Streptomyces sp. NA04227]
MTDCDQEWGNAVVSAVTETQRRAPKPRADALRNRERIVAAAREMFVEYGAEIALDEVARRAGIGNATVYRHFPDRTQLMHAVLLEVMDSVQALASRLLVEANKPGGDAFAALRAFALGAADKRIGALCPALSAEFDRNHPDLVAARERIDKAVGALMTEARAAGQLRDDVDVGDLMVALAQLTRPLPGTACLNMDQFVRRHLEVFLDGLMAPARSRLPGVPATLEALRDG